jgi:hypothetical protein
MKKRYVILLAAGTGLLLLIAILLPPKHPQPVFTVTPPLMWTIPGTESVQETETPVPAASQPLNRKNTATPPAVDTPIPQTGRSFYAAPDGIGSPKGDGSKAHPWDLPTALKGPDAVHPGDTIWLSGGLYAYRSLDYLYSYLKGEPGKPITVRAILGERVTLDAALVIQGPWTTIWGLEVIDSTLDRTAAYVRKDGIAVWAPNVKLINNIVHDAGGLGFWWQAEDAEMYGNIIYNNGYIGKDRGHGHGLYTTNKDGLKLIEDNILFNSFSGINVHAYSEKTYLNGFLFEGNVSFNGHFLVGGLVPASNVSLKDNMFYRGAAQFGYRAGVKNSGLLLTGNFFHADDGECLTIRGWADVRAANNIAWQGGLSGVLETVLSDGKSYALHKMGGTTVILRPNTYEPGRGNIVIYNWDKLDSVPVDLSQMGWKPGEKYLLHNVQNYYDETIQGVYKGQPIQVPMTGWSTAIPTGWDRPFKPVTFPEFGVFVIERIE